MTEKHLFLLPTANIGGAERVTFNIIYHLLNNGKDVTLITMSGGKTEDWDLFKTYKNFKWICGDYNSEKSSLIPITLTLLKLNLIHNYNYIFTTHVHTNSYISFLKKIGLFPKSTLISRESFSVFKVSTGFKKHLFKFFYNFLYGEQDLLIFQTKEMHDSLIENLGFTPTKKSVVLPNPVNLEFIESSTSNLSKEKFIVACGRFVKVKQFDLLIKSFYRINRSHPEYKLIIIGDGQERKVLEDKINDLNLQDKVVLTGRLVLPFNWFSRSRIGVISSKIEGFPNVLLEMMASGVSNIVSTPCTDSIQDIPNLIVTENCNEEDLFKGLMKAIESSNTFDSEYRDFISKHHSVKSYWNQIQNLTN